MNPARKSAYYDAVGKVVWQGMATTLFSQASVSRWGSGGATHRSLNESVEGFPMAPLESMESIFPEAEGSITVSAPLRADIPSSAPAAVSTVARFRFADLLRPDGTVDTDAVYRFGKVPPVKLSADQLLQALAKLPADISEHDRHVMIQVMVNSLTQAANIPVETILADARLRHTRLNQFQEALSTEFEHDCQPMRQNVEDLESLIRTKEAELEALRGELVEQRARAESTHRDIGAKLSGLEEVIHLLEPTVAVTDRELP